MKESRGSKSFVFYVFLCVCLRFDYCVDVFLERRRSRRE